MSINIYRKEYVRERKKKLYFVKLLVYCTSYRLILKYWLAKLQGHKVLREKNCRCPKI